MGKKINHSTSLRKSFIIKTKPLLTAVFLIINYPLSIINCSAQIINTIAGNGANGYGGDGGPATSAMFSISYGIAVDASGNVYFSDQSNDRIRVVNTSGVISTFAGTGVAGFSGDGGPAASAKLNGPAGIAVDASGNIYITDCGNYRIRKINTSGVISTIAGTGNPGYSGDGGPATSAEFGLSYGVVVDASGSVYFSDENNECIRKINASGIISTFAGTGVAGYSGDGGPATNAMLYNPYGVSVDASGNVYIADRWNHRIRKVNTSGVISTFAGTGAGGYNGDGIPAASATLKYPFGVAVDACNIYIADTNNDRIRIVNTSGIISTIAGNGTAGYSGNGGPAASAMLQSPHGIVVDASGNVYFTDTYNYRIRKVDPISMPCCALSVSITSQTDVSCFSGSNGTASASVSGGSPTYTYQWSNGQTSSTATGLSAGTYTVTIAGSSSCTATQTVTITQPPAITASTTVASATCGSNNGSANVFVSGGTPSYIYSWSNGNTTSALGGLAVGNYSVLVTDANGCTQTANVAVTQTGGPTAVAGTTATILSGSSASLNASGGITYSWAPSASGGLSCATCANPVASPAATTEYCVYVFDTAGCFDSACVTVYVIDPVDCIGTDELFIPNAFSPNDDGENDVLKIYYGDIQCIETFKMVIYNRWGEKVFTTADPSKAWDGMYRGKPLNSAVFVYYLKATMINGKKIVRKGNISLGNL